MQFHRKLRHFSPRLENADETPPVIQGGSTLLRSFVLWLRPFAAEHVVASQWTDGWRSMNHGMKV